MFDSVFNAMGDEMVKRVKPLLEQARAEGYAAGLEAAAKWHHLKVQKIHSSYDGPTRNSHMESAKAIRALGKEEKKEDV